ncbi:MAG TPA: sulfatase [Phenylobacterium sp.]|uniref:sulfatase family protein n=1 Tax=Phenylobacterium sp. TaxID=1871053 RepID=UPI002CF2BAE8|nr:sulfatase [Phenylobacterium sp.]HSV04723.1 sulfatase [Phenylobacterium sp.]
MSQQRGAAGARPPNFVVVLCDDLGWGDIGVCGGRIPTPTIDRMAAEGVLLTDYYAPANICSPSRAGLLTGRYPVRTGLGFEVIMQQDDRGLPLSEPTIAKALKPAYASALFGKWHLGHRGEAWPPTRHGFDTFFGIPYSHDMKPLAYFEAHAGSDDVVESAVDLPQLQQRFYAHAERFIEVNRERPFFVELALSSPHLPPYPHPDFDARGFAGPYGAVVEEIDSIMARLLAKLAELGLAEDTIVVFTSDNGPWFEGSPGWLRERKGGGAYDGGYRVPCIVWGPGRIPAGRRHDAICMGIDVLPTLLALSGLPAPAGVALDGRDLTEVIMRGAPSPHEHLVLFDNEDPIGIRTQRWKYIASAYYRGARLPTALLGYEQLYDLAADPSENYSVASVHPQVAADLRDRLAAAKAEFAPYRLKEVPPYFKAMRARLRQLQD